jgi:hypothetical protein
MVRSGSSYASQSDLTQTFGLGADGMVQAIEVEWPSGMKDRLTNVAANQRITIVEGKGQVARGVRVPGRGGNSVGPAA